MNYILVLSIIIEIVHYFLDLSFAVPAIHLQVDSKATIYSWAKWDGNFPETSKLTACLYYKILKLKPVLNTLVSYAVEQEANEYSVGKYHKLIFTKIL